MEFAKEDRLVTLYGYDKDTKEFTYSFEYLWVKGTGIAADSTLIQPPIENKEGFAKVFNGSTWSYSEDHRGKVIYSTTGLRTVKVVESLGKIEKGFTDLVPTSKYETWNNGWLDTRTEDEIIADKAKSFPTLTRRQFKLALLDKGLLDDLELAIANIENMSDKKRIEIEYTESTEFVRTSESIKTMFTLINQTEERINELWEKALAL